MDLKLLESLLSNGEGINVEFKEKLDLESKEGKAKFLRTILALANSPISPSFLIIGVQNETKHLVGISDTTEEQLQQLVARYCQPPIFFTFKIVQYQNVPIGVVQISRSNLKPHTVKDEFGYFDTEINKQQNLHNNQVFLRRGSVIDVANVDEIIAMAHDRDNESEERARAAAHLERIGIELENVTDTLRDISREVYDSRPRQHVDKLLEGTFLSIITGGFVGWLIGLGWMFAPVVAPLIGFVVSVIASTLKIVHYGILRAAIISLVIGVVIGLLYNAALQIEFFYVLLEGSSILKVAFGAIVGAIVGVVVLPLLLQFRELSR